MTPEQKEWLAANPSYSLVRRVGIVTLKNWTDEGYLFKNGRFVADDGQTLFPHEYPSWFKSSEPAPLRVGRHYDIV